MKILLLSEMSSIHTLRWATALHKQDLEIAVFSIRSGNIEEYTKNGIKVFTSDNDVKPSSSLLSKSKYLMCLNSIKKVIQDFSPDILHAHYASSYGLLGALTKFKPYVVSVWGSDVYDFPKKNFINKLIIKFVLKKADYLLSTSHIMAKEAASYTKKKFIITPFGVDINVFKPSEEVNRDFDLVGCIKALRKKYGIDILIKAFAICVKNNPNRNLKLQIVGKGEDEDVLKNLAINLGLKDRIIFSGFIPNEKLPLLYSKFCVSVFPSIMRSESFGVVAVESMACCCPVIASDADGFTEVIDDNVTGILVSRNDIYKTANAMQLFLDHPDYITRMGIKGRERVIQYYNWTENVTLVTDLYNNIIKNSCL